MNSVSVPIMISQKPVCIVQPLLKPNNHPPLRPGGRVNEGSFGIISFEGLPQGSSAAQVVRCIQLLEHAPSCGGPGGCLEGEGCRRTRQVLAHHFGCRNRRRGGPGECNVCRQLLALCRNHSERCQANAGNCAVPYCKNKEVKVNSNPNITLPNPCTEEPSREEQQYVIRKLSETMDLPTTQQKLRGIKYLMETNRDATAKVFRSILGKKIKPQPVSPSHDLKNLVTSKGMQLTMGKSPQRVLNPKIWSPAATRWLKLNVVVRGPLGSPIRQSTSIVTKCD